jgi:hypothetical protein
MKKLIIMATVGMVLLAPFATAKDYPEYMVIPVQKISGGFGTVIEYANKAVYNQNGEYLDIFQLGLYGFMDLRWVEMSTGLFIGPSNFGKSLKPIVVLTPGILYKFPVLPEWPIVNKGDIIWYPVMLGFGMDIALGEIVGIPVQNVYAQIGTGIDRVIGDKNYLRFQFLATARFISPNPPNIGVAIKVGVGFAEEKFGRYHRTRYLQ